MKAMAQKLSILLAVTLAFILCAGLANAAIPVKPGEKIQNAIDAADPGDTIIVESGTYIESLMVNKSIILRGIDTGSGIPLIESEDGPAITLKADGITIEGFGARSVSSWKEDAGILIQSNDNVIKNNLVKGNGNAGMVLNRCINNSISGNIVQGNGNEGIYLKNSSRNRLEGNRVMENGYGLKLEDSHTNEIVGNLFEDNRFEAIHLHMSHSNLIESNYAQDSEVGLALEKSRSNLVQRNDILGNEKGVYLSRLQSRQGVSSNGKGVLISYNRTLSGASTSSNNTIYLNNFSNEQNAYDDGLNRWDNGLIGNNYSNFNDPEEGCSARKICNSHYPIPGAASMDEYPQASPITMPGQTTGRGGSFMQLPGTSFLPGSEMRLNYSTPQNIDVWLGRQSGALTEGNLSSEIHLGENKSGNFILIAPQSEGSYWLIMHDGNASSIMSLFYNVSMARINASPASVSTCERITVSFQGARGQEKDWIGMYKAGSQDATSYQLLEGRESGEVAFTIDEAGSYIFQMFAAGEINPLASSNPVEVRANSGHKVIAEPSQVAPGGSVTVTYWGAKPASVVGMYGVTSPDKFDSGKRSTGGKSCGSMVWQLPAIVGQYDFRMFGDDVNRPILAYSNVVTVA